MTTINIKVNGATATATASGKLTSGMVGVPVTIEYDESWNGLYKTASFRVNNLTRSREGIGTATIVPWEVMRHSGRQLLVGVEGRNENGNIVIPTTWAIVGPIFEGAVASTPAAPNPDVGELPTTGAVIDDSQISTHTTWSSQKISEEIGNGGGEGGGGFSPIAKVEQTENGARITITDATGTTTADVQNGYTPVRGTDYWTDADKAEIKSYVDEAILGGEW